MSWKSPDGLCNYGTFLPMLSLVLEQTDGPVVEFGGVLSHVELSMSFTWCKAREAAPEPAIDDSIMLTSRSQ